MYLLSLPSPTQFYSHNQLLQSVAAAEEIVTESRSPSDFMVIGEERTRRVVLFALLQINSHESFVNDTKSKFPLVTFLVDFLTCIFKMISL